MTTIAEPAPNDDSPLDAKLDQMAALLREAADIAIGRDSSFASREASMMELLGEAGRRCLQGELQRMSDRHAAELNINGVRHRRHTEGTGVYHSLCGTLRIRRWTYRPVGERGAPSVVPLELEAGLMEGATPMLASNICLGLAKGDSRSVHENLVAAARQPPSRATIERKGKALGSESRRAVHRVEAWLRQSEDVPEAAVAASIGLDRTSAPMEEDRPEGQAPKTPRKKRQKPYVRTPPGPVDVHHRMAYVGTFCLTDADGEVLVARRYAASAGEGPDGLLRRVMADLRNALRRRPDLKVGVVQDGAVEMWNLVRAALRAEPRVGEWFEAIDRYHLSEHLGKALQLVEGDASERARQMSEWGNALDTDDTTIVCIEEWLAEEVKLSEGTVREKLTEELTYLRNNKDRMRYVEMRAVGLPVGSGVTEGACGSVVGRRAKGSGRRWRPDGLDNALTLRGLYCSDRLPRFTQHLSRRYMANVALAA